MIAALVGNPNCGKTTLFNSLTASNVRVGNYPGVTVGVSTGVIKEVSEYELADLPGIYSLSDISEDERCALSFIERTKPDLIINVADASTLRRGLYLSLCLAERRIPMIIALSMTDEMKKSGGKVDTELLSREIGVPVVCAYSDNGTLSKELLGAIKSGGALPSLTEYKKQSLSAVCGETEHASFGRKRAGIKHGAEEISFEKSKQISETEHDKLIESKYYAADKLYAVSVSETDRKHAEKGSDCADKVLAGKLSYLIFALIMLTMFAVTFGIVSPFVSYVFDSLSDCLCEAAESLSKYEFISPLVGVIICDGIIKGVGSVISFLPVILTFFLMMSLIEDSGYAARAAFIFDFPMRRLGLSGKCIVPLITGGGCTVPAVMSSRTLTSGKERALCIFLIPYISCSAKIPVYTAVGGAVFGGRSALVVLLLYVFGLTVGVSASSAISHICNLHGGESFLLEIPPYRMPTSRTVFSMMLKRSREFISRAFSIIFVSSSLISLASALTPSFACAAYPEESILWKLGEFASPLFKPLGFGTVPFAAAVICGIAAKEAIVSTLAVTVGFELSALGISPAAAVAFLVFVCIGVPCAASLGAVRQECGSAVRCMIYSAAWFIISYILSFAAYRVALLIL